MMDVNELRSLFMTKDQVSGEKAFPSSSGEKFSKTLSGFSRTQDVPSERLSSPDRGTGFSGPAVPGPGEEPGSGDRNETASPAASEEAVSGYPSAFAENTEETPSKNAGARVYRRLLPGGGVSPEGDLCEDLRQLELSARVFGAKPEQGSREVPAVTIREKEGEERGSDGPEDGSLALTGNGVTETVAVFDGSAGGPINGELSPTETFLLQEDKASSGGRAGKNLSSDVFDRGILAKGQESGVRDSSSGVDGFFSSRSTPEETSGEFHHEAPIAGDGLSRIGGSVEAPSWGMASAMFKDPAVGKGLNGEDFSLAAESGEAVQTVPESVGDLVPSKFPAGRELPTVSKDTDTGDGDFLTDPAGPGSKPETGVPQGGFGPDGEDGPAAGRMPDVSPDRADKTSTENPVSTFLPGRDGEIGDLERENQTREEGLSSSFFSANPMEEISLKTAGGDVLLEARGVEALARGLAETVHVVRKREGHTGRIEVSPPDLGQVRITVESSGDKVQVHLRVQSAEVRDMLDQTADVLKQALADKGLSLTGMSVDVGGQGADEGSRGWGAGSDPVSDLPGDDVAAPAEDEEVIARLDLERGMLHWVA